MPTKEELITKYIKSTNHNSNYFEECPKVIFEDVAVEVSDYCIGDEKALNTIAEVVKPIFEEVAKGNFEAIQRFSCSAFWAIVLHQHYCKNDRLKLLSLLFGMEAKNANILKEMRNEIIKKYDIRIVNLFNYFNWSHIDIPNFMKSNSFENPVEKVCPFNKDAFVADFPEVQQWNEEMYYNYFSTLQFIEELTIYVEYDCFPSWFIFNFSHNAINLIFHIEDYLFAEDTRQIEKQKELKEWLSNHTHYHVWQNEEIDKYEERHKQSAVNFRLNHHLNQIDISKKAKSGWHLLLKEKVFDFNYDNRRFELNSKYKPNRTGNVGSRFILFAAALVNDFYREINEIEKKRFLTTKGWAIKEECDIDNMYEQIKIIFGEDMKKAVVRAVSEKNTKDDIAYPSHYKDILHLFNNEPN